MLPVFTALKDRFSMPTRLSFSKTEDLLNRAIITSSSNSAVSQNYHNQFVFGKKLMNFQTLFCVYSAFGFYFEDTQSLIKNFYNRALKSIGRLRRGYWHIYYIKIREESRYVLGDSDWRFQANLCQSGWSLWRKVCLILILGHHLDFVRSNYCIDIFLILKFYQFS